MKKNTKSIPIGRTVPVHPELATDPKSRQGKTGIVVEGNDYKNRC